MIGDLLLYAVIALLAGAALQDLWMLRISNVFPVAIFALYPFWLLQTGLELDIWQNIAVFVATLFVGALMFARNWLGGGDVKLLAAIALWFDFSGGLALLAYVTLGGGLLSLLFILVRRTTPATIREGSGIAALQSRGPIPYGLAIAAGATLCLHWHGPNPHAPLPKPAYIAAIQR